MIYLKEIQDFTLIYDGLFWIKSDKCYRPISIKPSDLASLFEQEGIDMKCPHEDDGLSVSYNFKKATLTISNYYYLQLSDEDHQDISPVHCEVKRQ